MRPLLVGDDPSLRMMLWRLLSREFSVKCFEGENGIAPLERLRLTRSFGDRQITTTCRSSS